MADDLGPILTPEEKFAQAVAVRMIGEWKMLYPTNAAVIPMMCPRCGKVEEVTLQMATSMTVDDAINAIKTYHRCRPPRE